MILGRHNRGLNLAALLTIEALITFSSHKALAESFPDELLEVEIPFQEFLTPAYNTTTSPIILSQVPNPVPPLPPTRQPSPNPVRPLPPPPQPIPTPQPLPEIPLDETPVKPPSSEPRPEIPGSITVKSFEFEGNTAFNDEKLRKVTEEFTNTPITFAQLLQVEAVITKLYTDAGYINSGAFIPADQAFSREGAVVKIEVVEGGIEDIKITGNRRLNSEYIRSRIRLGVSKPLNRNRLLKALQVLQNNPLIQNLSVELSVGSRPEQSLLEVKVIEADSFRTEFFVDNGRVPTVGSFRRGVRINEGNLFGFGDRATAIYTNTDGSNTLDLSYSVPLNPRNGTLTLSGGFADTNVIEPPFDRIDIVGDYFYVDLSYRQPIIETATQELALGLSLSRQQSQTQILGENFPLSFGADNSGETRLSTLRFFQEYTQRTPQQVLAFRSQFSLGVGLFDATVNSQPPDSRYFSWRGQGQYVRLLAPDTLFVFRSDAQLATRSLVPLEQFSIGGLQSVRGYRQDQLLVDNGFFASAEVRLPILRVNQVDGVLQIVPFIDFGIGWNSSGYRNPDPNTLVGTGVGLQWQMGNQLNARLDYGFPLIDVNSSDRTLQEQGLYFSVNYSPF
ncbi:ShlB/FhaC/HecB family hemolysin secretion/activation protein [Hassallia byssoidea VB512170]|uniref:ShlB/FhaC/HecB family hemolysin secretion/activation protein n=1 Tax=Hassallia byssoidea VB512170 TaxID=1304833 RepID=A0A846H6S4_9CYAN|nr:ShlB/FhaC/HecB family hemolysin secretion/activation protein [Hassalia byssoidea]NEU73052.1 ShlB/FhaC/HecB family hemolysin secretion/activation protein [Hassalia byssoidea VB512170]